MIDPIMVTGASSGIGRAIALDLAAKRYRLYLVDLPDTQLDEVCDQCQKKGAQIAIHPIDLVSGDLEALTASMVKKFGGIAALIHSAGVFLPSFLSRHSQNDVTKTIQCNLNAAINLANSVTPYLLKNTRSHLIFMSSLAAKKGFPGLGAYAASKAGLRTFLDIAFAELRQAGVKVTCIMPSFIDTPLTEGMHLDKNKMLNVSVIVDTVNYVLQFHDSGCPTEIVIETQKPAITQ